MLHDIYAHLQQRGFTRSERHFSTVWCGRAPNYLADTGGDTLSPATGIELCRRLLHARQADLANRVIQWLILGRRPAPPTGTTRRDDGQNRSSSPS